MEPKISVIMPVYNTEKYVEDAINSIINQKFSNWELIIINDASNDKTASIIQKYQNSDKRILCINNRTRVGNTKSRIEGIEFARGEYIALLDADDISLPDRLIIQYNFLKNNQNISLVASPAIYIDENNNILGTSEQVSDNKIYRILPKNNPFINSSILYRRGIQVYREKFKFSSDYDFFLLLLSKKMKMHIFSEPLIKYRIHETAIGEKKILEQYLFANQARFFYNQRKKNIIDDYNKFLPSSITNKANPTLKDVLILQKRINIACILNKKKEMRQNIYKFICYTKNIKLSHILLLIKSIIPNKNNVFIKWQSK